ncbi:hypothetical protein RhiirA4_480193 [Rhizophagus irregularis]|uniref:Uncharacterized protein n=1 Tax=Rhizophagus irregularis TaxID=588596 RepID=A0A2I1HHK0_9GLOM|nr:hypothetical protein RhiirA4_480193 [Rhizophagus irregularis]
MSQMVKKSRNDMMAVIINNNNNDGSADDDGDGDGDDDDDGDRSSGDKGKTDIKFSSIAFSESFMNWNRHIDHDDHDDSIVIKEI